MQRIILVSHCLRGSLWSIERRTDIRSVREHLARLKKLDAYLGATLTVPYLLYGESSEEVVGIRERGEAGYGLVPHTEALVVGTHICRGVLAEAARALAQGLPVATETASMNYLLEGLFQDSRSAA